MYKQARQSAYARTSDSDALEATFQPNHSEGLPALLCMQTAIAHNFVV